MPVSILMPALSPTMEEGTLSRWLVNEGDDVSSGDVIAEIETDKATMEVEAVDEGVVGRILIPSGTEGVKVNTPIAVLLEEGESPEEAAAMEAATVSPRAGPVLPPPAPGPAQVPASSQAERLTSPPEAGPGAGKRIFASPLARRLAEEVGLDLGLLRGTGPHGRVIKRDVDKALADGLAQPAEAAAPRPLPDSASADQVKALYEAGTYEELPLDAMRRIIAARLTEAKQTIPHFYLTVDVEIDALLAARARANAALAERGAKLSVNDYCIKAVALALRDTPDCNVAFAGDRILRFGVVDVAVAVAVEGGLFTPVLRRADAKPISVLSAEMKELASRARARRLSPGEYQGGAIAVSNLGMFGIRNFDAVINPPHGSILALGAGEKRPVVREGGISAATIMTVTLSVDHRAIDGALGARFLAAFRKYVEDPAMMAI